MSDQAQGPGWWMASDGKWYPPETHPDYRPPPPPAGYVPPPPPPPAGYMPPPQAPAAYMPPPQPAGYMPPPSSAPGLGPLAVKGVNGTVVFDGVAVTIQRTGAMARMSIGKGDKRIPLRAITAVQWKNAGLTANGFIQFSLAGGSERRSKFGSQTVDAAKDENSVVFSRGQQAAFEQLRAAIEQSLY